MPKPKKFLEGFQLVPGHYFDGYKVVSADSTHEVIVRYRKYKYEITVVFQQDQPDGNYEDLYDDLLSEIDQEKTIYTSYGNPYRCWIDPPAEGSVVQEGDRYIFHLVGHSERI